MSKQNKDNIFSIQTLKRAKVNRFDFLSIDSAYFEKEICPACKKKSVLGKNLYKNANNYFSEFLDIETLFVNYQEVDMLKKILFDHDQRKLFVFLSKLSNLPNIFSSIDKNENVDLLDNFNCSEIINLFQRINERSNENDIKLIHFSKNLLKN